MKIDFKTSNIVVQYVFKKIMLIWKGVDIVSCCVNCQCVIYVILCIKSSVSGECCIRYYTVVSLATVYPKTYAHGFCFAVLFVVIYWLIFPYPSGLLHCHCGNLTIAPVPAKQPWWIWINTWCEFIMSDCITTTKQSTTKPCAYFLGYTVSVKKMHIVCQKYCMSLLREIC